jgi:hypothetical protein
VTNPSEDIYGNLGEAWWVKAGEEVRATPQQVKFAAARYNGATRAKAAALGGYRGDAQGLRSAGSRVDDTDTVKALIALAAATEAGTSYDQYTVAQAKLKVGNLVKHSRDPLIVFKGTEVLSRLERDEAEANVQPEPSVEEALYEVIASIPEGHVGAFFALSAFNSNCGGLTNFQFLRECAPVIARDYPKEWSQLVAKQREDWRPRIEEAAKGPVLEGDSLINAVKARLWAKNVLSPKPSNAEISDNG